jgi:Trypsin-like peptidase domain
MQRKLLLLIVLLLPLHYCFSQLMEIQGLKKYVYYLHLTIKVEYSTYPYWGSGFFIKHSDHSYFVTAKHMLFDSPKLDHWRGAISATIGLPVNNEIVDLTIPFTKDHPNVIPITLDTNTIDIAVIEINPLLIETIVNYLDIAKIDTENIRKGTPVFSVGFPGYSPLSPVVLESSLTEDLKDSLNRQNLFLYMDQHGEAGMSGGPLIVFKGIENRTIPALIGIVLGMDNNGKYLNKEKFTNANVLRIYLKHHL